MSSNEDYYNAVGAWFLGTRGENADVIGELFQTVLRYQVDARRRFHPNDESPYTNNMMSSQAFGDSIEKLREIINTLAPHLAGSAIPFFSPRYIAHMSMDVSMPGLVGYLLTMMFNQNNVAIEASPLTTSIEITVGKELAELVGYSTNTTVNPVGWGHITCDGSVANLESVWAARNLKFYPLSLYNAMKDELRFVADTFEVPTAQGEIKLLRNFSTWELLNITPHDVLDLPTRLGDQYGITPSFLGNVMHKYVIQTVGKDSLEKQFNIQLSGHALASATMHYSWPKAAAVTGIGSDNMVGIKVDDRARMSIPDLRAHLDKCISEQRFVYMVTAIIGTTEHGAADPLHEIELLRREYQQKGLSFVIHADGAWGGYFASMVSPELRKQTLERLGLGKKGAAIPSLPKKQRDSFVPTAPLNDHTLKAIVCLQFADSITIDPHKSGYVQYPAGGLLYRDQRMRYLVTWTSPIVFRDTEESIGIYGIEGSKPGAAPVAVWCSHQVIGLNTHGYGQVLGQAMFGGIKMYAHLATMSTDEDPFIVITMNKLPAEENNEGPEKIAEQKKEIREKILNVSNRDLFNDKEAWALATSLGSDLTINAFAVNFKINGHVNTDIVEANYLNTRIFNRVSIVNVETEEQLNQKPLILTSTVLSQDAYGLGLTQFKNRLHLYDGGDLYTLVNVVMSPFPTIDNLMEDIAASLKQVIQEELQVSLFRNTLTPDLHGFVMQGTEQIYLVHLAMFYMENHRMQLVITGDLDSTTLQKYRDSKKDNEGTVYILGTSNETTLETILKDKEFDVDVFKGFPSDTNRPIASGKLSNIQVVVQRDLHTSSLTPYPPRTMPFSLYGSIEHGWHIDHIYTSAPNIQLSGESVQFDQSIFKNHAAISPSSHIYAHFDLPESAMQPFASDAGSETNPTFFKPGAVFHNVRITTGEDPYSMWYGNVDLTLGKAVFVDAHALNDNPEPEVHSHAAHAANVATKTTKHFCLPEPKPIQKRKWLNIVEQAGTGIRSAKAKAK